MFEDNLEIARLTAQARILHVNKGDNPSFSDRTLYPYAFRVLRSVQGATDQTCGNKRGWWLFIPVLMTLTSRVALGECVVPQNLAQSHFKVRGE